MLIRMNTLEQAGSTDPFARLDSILNKVKAQAAGAATGVDAPPQPPHHPVAAAGLDFSDPLARESFMGSLRGISGAETEFTPEHNLDPAKVAALLDFD